MLRLAFDFIITWRETRTRPNAYSDVAGIKELQFRTTINSIDVLNRYYEAN